MYIQNVQCEEVGGGGSEMKGVLASWFVGESRSVTRAMPGRKAGARAWVQRRTYSA